MLRSGVFPVLRFVVLFVFSVCGITFAQAPTKSFLPRTETRYISEVRKQYSFYGVSAEEKATLDKLIRIQKVVSEIYDDRANGKVDLGKFRELKRLTDSLPGDLPEPEKEKKSFWSKLFGSR